MMGRGFFQTARRPALMALSVAIIVLGFRRELFADCSCPEMTRAQIVDIAKSGVGSPYVWGGTCWDPQNRQILGADCSGYVSKCWQVPTASAVTACTPHSYNTDSFYSQSTHWDGIPLDAMRSGDALVYRKGDEGHIVLFDQFTATSGCYEVYEARGTAYGIVYRVKCPDASYQARRRHRLLETTTPPANQEPQGILEKADCEILGGWAYDPDAKDSPIAVHLVFDGVPGQSGVTIYQTQADGYRDDLCQSLGSCNHGFALALPSRFKDGKMHSIRAYAIDTAKGKNPELASSPKSIQCNRPTVDSGPDPLPIDGPSSGADIALEDPNDAGSSGLPEGQGGCDCQVLTALNENSSHDQGWFLLAVGFVFFIGCNKGRKR